MSKIDSTDDARLAPYRDLRADRDRRNDATFICEGHLCVERALKSGWKVRSLLTTETQLQRLNPAPGVLAYVATPALLQAITGFKFHRGVLAEVEKPALAEADFTALAKQEHSTTVFAEVVSNPSNLGALMRNARSLGADLLVLSGATDPFSRRAVRTSMGALFELPLAVARDVTQSFHAFRQATNGEVLAATLGQKARPLKSHERKAHLAIVMGSEGEGLDPKTIAACDVEVTIEMSPGADSLNVAAASAVLLYALAPSKRATPSRNCFGGDNKDNTT